jgi:hypothetical protein
MIDAFRQLKNLISLKPLWLLLYAFKAIVAAMAIIPFYMTFSAYLAPSEFSRTLADSWDFSVIAEILATRGDSIPPLLGVVLVAAIAYLLLIQFLNGGLYYIVVSGRMTPVVWRDFFSECGIRLQIHIKITAMMLLLYLVLIVAGLFLVNMIDIAGRSLMGFYAAVFMFFKLSIILLILLGASLFSMTCRAVSAAYPDKSFREIMRIGSEYFRPRLFGLAGLFLTTFFTFLIIWLILQWLSLRTINVVPGFIGILLEFAIFQISAISRTGQTVWFLVLLGKGLRSVHPGRFIPEQAEFDFGR